MPGDREAGVAGSRRQQNRSVPTHPQIARCSGSGVLEQGAATFIARRISCFGFTRGSVESVVMAHEFRITRRVEFAETDMAGLVHYSNFFRYMEAAEHAFFRSLGHSVVLNQFDPPRGLPRVHASCDYHHPLRFEDEVEVRLLVAEKRTKALSYVFHFRKLNADPPVEVARGKLTVVCVGHQRDGTLKAIALPREVADQIDVAPPELLG